MTLTKVGGRWMVTKVDTYPSVGMEMAYAQVVQRVTEKRFAASTRVRRPESES